MAKRNKKWMIEISLVSIIILILLIYMIPSFIAAQNVNNSTYFPDDAFRKVMQEKLGVGPTDIVKREDLAQITDNLDCSGKGIKSLKGIEFFYNIKHLACGDNQLTELDISKLTQLNILYCTGNQLRSLDLSNLDSLNEIYCSYNQLIRIIPPKNNNIWFLEINDNQFEEFNCASYSNLSIILLSNNPLMKFKVGHNPELSVILLVNNQLDHFPDLFNLPEIGCLNIQNNLLNPDDWQDIERFNQKWIKIKDKRYQKNLDSIFLYSPQKNHDPYEGPF